MSVELSERFTYKKLIRFTLPTIIMIIFTSIYGVVDGIFVSNFVGSDSFASVNLIWPAIAILGTIFRYYWIYDVNWWQRTSFKNSWGR